MDVAIRQLVREMVDCVANGQQATVIPNVSFTPQVVFCLEQLRQITNIATQLYNQLNIIELTESSFQTVRQNIAQVSRARPYFKSPTQQLFIPEGSVDTGLTPKELLAFDPDQTVKYVVQPRPQTKLQFMKLVLKKPNGQQLAIQVPYQSWNNLFKTELVIEQDIAPELLYKVFVRTRGELRENIAKMAAIRYQIKAVSALAAAQNFEWLQECIAEVQTGLSSPK